MAVRALNTDPGIIVWHGSGHVFDRFSTSKINTGTLTIGPGKSSLRR